MMISSNPQGWQRIIDYQRRNFFNSSASSEPVDYLALLGTRTSAGTVVIKVECDIERIMYALEWRTVSALTRGLFWCLFPELQSNEGNKHKNNTWVSAEAVCHESTYIILFVTRHDESTNDDKNNNLYIAPVSHLLCDRSGDDVIIDCWWRHNDQTSVIRSHE